MCQTVGEREGGGWGRSCYWSFFVSDSSVVVGVVSLLVGVTPKLVVMSEEAGGTVLRCMVGGGFRP